MIHLPWDCLGKQHYSCMRFQSYINTVKRAALFHYMYFRLQSMYILWPIYGGQHPVSMGEESPGCLWMYACMLVVCSTCVVMHVCLHLCSELLCHVCVCNKAYSWKTTNSIKMFFCVLFVHLHCLRGEVEGEGYFIFLKHIELGGWLHSQLNGIFLITIPSCCPVSIKTN